MSPDHVSKVLKMDVSPVPEYTSVFLIKLKGKYLDFDKGKDFAFFERLDKDTSSREKYERARKEAEHRVFAGSKRFAFFNQLTDKSHLENKILEGVSDVFLNFYKNSLYSISISYKTKDISWKDSQDFALSVSEILNLPKEYWIRPTLMLCPGFSLNAYANSNYSSLYLIDTQKKKELLDEAKRVFIEQEALP